MKITNYNRGYIDFFNCVIHGKIVVSNEEWGKIQKYAFKYAYNPSDFLRFKSVKGGRLYDLRITTTEKIVKHFGLKNYKKGNYLIEVLN